MSLLVNTEYSTISQPGYQHIPLQRSVAQVFKKAGYKTLFVYTGFEELSNRSYYFKHPRLRRLYWRSTINRALLRNAHHNLGRGRQIFFD